MSANPKRIPKTVGNILCIELLTLLNKGLYSLGNR